ncbi:hypothetical protein NDK47_09230 [Brevibacillus ruminantium]|uniref:Senescence domain-containing protein n=1 Tax=Brevibacillus ruminantium TaxID=2950604 RepID=A0ABY4WS74_9BACL|nr:hypothetical protein [Brevibacillus ruminantium]USG67436.1 hypothetical protein NDK47_09230 [Brevibacillus ruminantium]
MGLLKDLGMKAGEVTGLVLGGSVRVVGELTETVTGSKSAGRFIKEIGNGVEHATKFTGKTAGEIASGTWDMAAGVLTQDQQQFEDGCHDVGEAVTTTVNGVGRTFCHVVENGANVVNGLKDHDEELMQKGAKGLVYAAAIGAIAVGVVDMLGGDGVPLAEDADDASHL